MVIYRYIRYLVAMMTVIVIFSGNCMTARAESGINAEESRVIGVASGTFEYNGETYAAKQEYIDMLTSKLNQDGVDMTSEQADAAISQIYANVEKGVREGYIVKVQGSDNNDKEPSDNKAYSTDGSKGKADKSNSDKSNADNNSGRDSGEPDPTPVPQVVAKDNGTVDVYTDDGDKAASFEGVLKNTGYSVNRTIMILGGLAMIFVVMVLSCLVYINKNKKSIAKDNVSGT